MESEGFSITNVDIIGKTPCCDVKLTMDGSLVFQKEKISFEEVKELMSNTELNCASIVRQLESFRSRA